MAKENAKKQSYYRIPISKVNAVFLRSVSDDIMRRFDIRVKELVAVVIETIKRCEDI
ncbi:unnamed protein product [marine sediment metagenome]|uniref:Uncharacterized protein n=1 Tax=marine sediment metagenome TaxID=412755 RepID=X1B4Z0_9ZZZZ